MRNREAPDAKLMQRGQRAMEVLDNPAYTEAMANLHADVITAWKECPVRDTEGQRILLQLAKLADKFSRILADYVEAGELVRRQLEIDDVRDESGMRRALRKVI
jgi:hypothetical protein